MKDVVQSADMDAVETAEVMLGLKTEKELSAQGLSTEKYPNRFKKGWKGGPGRPKGSVSAAGRFRQVLTEEHGEELLQIAMNAVRTGKANSLLGVMLQFIAGQQKSELAPIDLPEAQHGTYEERTDAITRAMLGGQLSPDSAKTAIEQLKVTEEARQLREMNDELRTLKARLVNGSAVRIS